MYENRSTDVDGYFQFANSSEFLEMPFMRTTPFCTLWAIWAWLP